jgi:hypothetical protein
VGIVMRLLSIMVVCVTVAACSDSATAPTAQPAVSGLSEPRLKIDVDGLDAAVAIAAVSRVNFDARDTPGDKLTFEIQFGDGTSASGAMTSHVYDRPGTYSVQLTVIDARGRRAFTTQSVVVKPLTGTWFHLGFIERSRQAEARRLTVTDQQGSVLRGVLARGSEPGCPFTGQLVDKRRARLVLDDQSEQYEGVVPPQIFAEGTPWLLTVRGGSADGTALPFEAIPGEPVGPSPTARLSMVIDDDGSTGAIIGFTPIQFDASGSTGDALRYVIDFGDGAAVTTPSAIHACERRSDLVARATVADRFGRISAASARYSCDSLIHSRGVSWSLLFGWFNSFQNPTTGRIEHRKVAFEQQNGPVVSGFYTHPDGNRSHFTGQLSGQNSLRIVLDGGGVEFTGRVIMSNSPYYRLRLLLKGGSANGATLNFVFHDPY